MAAAARVGHAHDGGEGVVGAVQVHPGELDGVAVEQAGRGEVQELVLDGGDGGSPGGWVARAERAAGAAAAARAEAAGVVVAAVVVTPRLVGAVAFSTCAMVIHSPLCFCFSTSEISCLGHRAGR